MHFASKFYYYMKESENLTKSLPKTNREKDLGVIFTQDVSCRNRILQITDRANRIFGSLKKVLVSRDSHLSKNLYILLVRPHFEYAVQVWSSTKERDIGLIEKVQARAIKIPHYMRNLRYEKNCKIGN